LLPGKGDAIKTSGAIAPPHSFRDLALPFLRHGLMAFGGPAAHVAMHHFPALQTSGDLRLGVWGQTGTFKKFNSESQNDADGIYAIFDQALWNPPSAGGPGRGLRTFLEYGRTDPSVAPIYQHFGGGVTQSGFLWGRPDDTIGVSPQMAQISSGMKTPHSYELALEHFYNLQLAPWVSVQPDFQYIINPGGKYSNALVGTLRLKVKL
jgi:porin